MIATLVAALVTAALAPSALRALPTRPNFRGAELPFPAGAVALMVPLLMAGPLEMLDAMPDHWIWLVFLGVGTLGLLDDLLSGSGRGLRGHARAILRGEFSTGALKALGTVSLVTMALWFQYEGLDRLWAILIVVLTTNLFNLFDLRPGRTAKVFVLWSAGLLLAGGGEHVDLVGPFAAPLLVLAVHDLRERSMLGDTGANLLGVIAGMWLLWVLQDDGLEAAVAVLAALTIFGEFGSFSRVIDRFPPLRALDSLGRKSHA